MVGGMICSIVLAGIMELLLSRSTVPMAASMLVLARAITAAKCAGGNCR